MDWRWGYFLTRHRHTSGPVGVSGRLGDPRCRIGIPPEHILAAGREL